MKSFRTELEDPIVEKDIIDLERNINAYKNNGIDEEKFRSLRLARGIYGQRQPGVQMIRIKIPYGKLTTKQLLRIADLSDEYASGTLHATTRQDIQIHFVSLEKTPELWSKLEKDNITLREACGNTVRNITASPLAGIDPDEPFDVSPYARAMFEYFLRNPICQEMGRKFKISFSSSEKDTGISFIHDLGFIPKIQKIDGNEQRGFKIMIGGGLGAQPHMAQVAHEFLAEEYIIPYAESILRIFDRYGERLRRQKARLKFLIKEIGLDKLHELAKKEEKALKFKSYQIPRETTPEPDIPENDFPDINIVPTDRYRKWLDTNVIEQKQQGFYAVYIKVRLGNISSDIARKFAATVKKYAADDIRITTNQGYLLKYVTSRALPHLYESLSILGLADPGAGSIADITVCPGTDTCNLGISNTTTISTMLEKVITEEFPDLIYNQDIKIKISGCPNSCGQHGIASIGFHGSSIKVEDQVMPALQVLLGGNTGQNGEKRVAEKVIKIPSKRGPHALKMLLGDYQSNKNLDERYSEYFIRKGKNYFYRLLKPLASVDSVLPEEFIDWGSSEKYKIDTAVGECAGVIIDLADTLFFEAQEKLELAWIAYEEQHFADSLYHSYSAFLHMAKGMLLTRNITCSTHDKVIKEFDAHFRAGEYGLKGSFEEMVLSINKKEPDKSFADSYFYHAGSFLNAIKNKRYSHVS